MSYSAKEIISKLSKPTSLLTVLVEGKDDALVYRCIEDKLNALVSIDNKADIFICGGRLDLLRHHCWLTKPLAISVPLLKSCHDFALKSL